jgi:hypothetical protein
MLCEVELAFKTIPPPDFLFGALKVFYNVSLAVGPTDAQNLVEDVMLVQFCINKIVAAGSIPPPPTGRTLTIDGKCGPITRAAILHFQTQVKAKGGSIRPDGLVEKANAFTAKGAHTRVFFTILWLNLGLKNAIGESRFVSLASDPDTPFVLAVALAARGFD